MEEGEDNSADDDDDGGKDSRRWNWSRIRQRLMVTMKRARRERDSMMTGGGEVL